MPVMVGSGFSEALESATVARMFEDRKSVFVDLLGWKLPLIAGRYEMDEFDDERATYLIVADDRGDHLGSARLLPTTRPHLLGTIFRDLCAGPPPSGPHIFEITRFCLSRRCNARSRRMTRNLLVSALVAHAFSAGIRAYTGVAEIAWLQQILAFGWRCRPLGPPARSDCGVVGALQIDIEAVTPELLAANGIWDSSAEQAGLFAEAA